MGHDRRHVEGCAAVTASTAVPARNIELDEAARTGIAVLTRAAMLSSICAQAKSLGVAGTHGKTSTTSMLMLILAAAGLRPSFIIGGDVTDMGTGAQWTGARVAGGRGRRERRHSSGTAAVRHDPDQRRDRSSRLLRHGGGDRRQFRSVSLPDLRAEGALHRRPGVRRTCRSSRGDHLRNVTGCRLSRRRRAVRSRIELVHGHPRG